MKPKYMEVSLVNKKHRPELVAIIVDQHTAGQTVAHLCAEHGLPRSTIYSWIKRHQKLQSTTNTNISHQDYYNLERRSHKLEERLEVIKAAGCDLAAPLQEKLMALEKLHGQYSVRTLCDALEVSRRTFYNHIFRI